eukprot:363399-Chlamydomonas_euryale.AAC.9
MIGRSGEKLERPATGDAPTLRLSRRAPLPRREHVRLRGTSSTPPSDGALGERSAAEYMLS